MMNRKIRTIALFLVLAVVSCFISGCGNNTWLSESVENLNKLDNYFYKIEVNIDISGGDMDRYVVSTAEMTYYPGTGEFMGEMNYDGNMIAPYSSDVYGVAAEEGGYWNYTATYQGDESTYYKRRIDKPYFVYNVGETFSEVARTGKDSTEGSRANIGGNSCQQYMVTIPAKDVYSVLTATGTVGDLEALGGEPRIIEQVLGEDDFQVEVWIDTVTKTPVRYHLDYTHILKRIFTLMGADSYADAVTTCTMTMNIYGHNMEEDPVSVPAKIKNEAVDITEQAN